MGRKGREPRSVADSIPKPASTVQDQADVVYAIKDVLNVLYLILKRLEGITIQLDRKRSENGNP